MDSSLNIQLYENALSNSADAFESLEREVQYLLPEDCKVKIRGKEYAVPRQLCAFGDEGLTYTFSGLTVNCQSWTPLLLEIKAQVESLTGVEYNFVLINRYKDGSCCIGQHKDNEVDLDDSCPIASLSLGETRTMVFKRPKFNDHRIELKDNSLLLMRPPTNQYWTHGIPPEKKRSGVRLNLTFRRISPNGSRMKRKASTPSEGGADSKKLKQDSTKVSTFL